MKVYLNLGSRDIHGFDGPIKVSFGNYTYPVMQDFLRATESQGIPTTDDLQDLVTGQYEVLQLQFFFFEMLTILSGAEHWLKWINRDVRRNVEKNLSMIS